jgi:CubicO group peptidase (beta-lactamase class C family)
MNLDDPVAKYLPATVKMSTRGEKQITLLHLATHMSGLPRDDTYFLQRNAWSDKVVAAYTMDHMYDFLSKHQLRRDPGLEFEYSNVGMALLAHAIALKAGTTYESLVMERICRPLHMDSTCFTITPELKPRLATGHDEFGKETPGWELDGYMGAGGLRSSVNDLLIFVSANMGLSHSTLTPLMEKTHIIRHRDDPRYGDTAMTWMDRGRSEETSRKLLGHAGGTGGYEAFIGFDKEHRRGVVLLSNKVLGQISERIGISERLGWFLLEDVPLSPEIAAGFSALSSGSVVGVGLGIKRDRPTHTLQTYSVLPNSPASKAGLTIGLTIDKIGGVPTAGKSIEYCTSLIRGLPGTPVQLELSDAAGKRMSVELTREKVSFPNEKKG